MSLGTFKGGAHPYEGKVLSENCAIEELRFDGEYIFPLSQHIGAPAKACVQVGDMVLAGQVIAEAGGFISANVLSSVSGTVKAIEPRMQVSGFPVMSVVVESDGRFETVEGYGQKRDIDALSKDEIRDIVKAAGIVGIGGAGFPTAVKLMPKNDDAIDYFDFSECLCDLVKTQHLTLSEDGLYAITDKGLRNSQICESSLPYSVRLRCDKNIAIWNRKLRRKSQVRAVWDQRANGTYTVRLNLDDDMGSVMDLRLMVVREDMAKVLSERFQKDPEKLYSKIMDLLLSDEE